MKQPYLNRARTWRDRPTETESEAAVAAQTPIEAPKRRLTFGDAAAAKPTDPAATARLVDALDVVLAASDAVSLAVTHFNTLLPDTDPPASWVERAVELHVALLEAWWALDDLAAVDAAAGGWTVGPPHAIGSPVERRKIRLRWETEFMAPISQALWWDRGIVAVKAATTEAAVEEAGRALIREGAKRRYASWKNTPQETTT